MRLPSQRERWEATETLPVHETPRTGWALHQATTASGRRGRRPLLRHKRAIPDAEARDHAHAHRGRLARYHRPIPYPDCEL